MSWKDDLNYGLAAFGLKIPDAVPVDEWTSKLADLPARNTFTLVLGSAAAFYAAERGHNPKVRDIYDALVYCSTCLSVGYSDIFARTPVGKLIGSTLMTIGPSMATSTLNGPSLNTAAHQAHREAVWEEILTTLHQILNKLENAQLPAENNGSAPPQPTGEVRM